MPNHPDHERPRVVNKLAGEVTAGLIAQAGAIQGGVHYHQPARLVVELPHRVGVVPPRAASYQERAPGDLLARAVGAGDAAILTADGPAGTSVVSGLGGVGKTQLAVDYAEQLWAAGALDLLVWVTATSRDAIVSSYARLAVDLTGSEDTDPEQGAQRLLAWLASTSKRWLVVLDDVRSPADLRGMWPPAAQSGRVVVTTRRRDAALHGQRRRLVEIDVFTQTEAVAYLTARFADHEHLVDDAAGLAHDLGYLPLALAQAAAFMLDRDLSCTGYRARLAGRRRSLTSLLPEAGSLPDEHQATVAATWSLSIEQADALEPVGLARSLLEVASVLAPSGFPGEVLTAPPVTEMLTAQTGSMISAEQARDALGCLHRLSLIIMDPRTAHRMVQLHPLVQRATLDTMPVRHARTVARVAADALVRVWPANERNPVLTDVLRANADALNDACGEHLWRPGVHLVLLYVGLSLDDRGRVAQARDHFERLLTTAIHRLGPDHPDTLDIRDNLARTRGTAGDLAGAIAAYEALLGDQQRLLGPGHPNNLITRANLAYFRGECGDLAGGIAAYEAMLGDLLRLFTADHPVVFSVRNNLARFRGSALDLAGAMADYRTLLSDLTRVLGSDHPSTLITRSNIIGLRGVGGDPAGAYTMAQDLLTDELRVLGPDNPNTLMTRSTLARWRGMSGDPAGAVTACEEILRDRRRVLGPDHPDTLVSRSNLALWRGMAGDTVGAVAAAEELLTDQLRVLGPNHAEVENTRDILAQWRT
jgi:tetratricopeptide (TPR) repeat protein